MSGLMSGVFPGNNRLWRLIGVCAVVLALLSPSVARAAAPAPFSAGGVILGISDGAVKPAGASGRWVVAERELVGNFDTGDLSGGFTLTYKANVELLTQAGALHGSVQLDSGEVLNLNGSIQPIEMVQMGPYWLPKLSMTGHWNFTSGAQGQGTFAAWAIVIPDIYGHILYIPFSDFSLTGQWQEPS